MTKVLSKVHLKTPLEGHTTGQENKRRKRDVESKMFSSTIYNF